MTKIGALSPYSQLTAKNDSYRAVSAREAGAAQVAAGWVQV